MTDADAFEWVELEHLTQFITPLLSISGVPTDVGVWILPLNTQELKEACRRQIENKGEYRLEAISIAVLAGWGELGKAIASIAIANESSDVETIICARAAEVLGSFTPEIAYRLRSLLGSGIEDQEDDENSAERAPTASRAMETAACLLTRNGTDDDRKYIEELVRDAVLEPALEVLVSLLDEGWEVAELFKNLQLQYLPKANGRDIAFFFELSVATNVYTDFDRLVELGRSDWIEGILLGMLRSPLKFWHEAGTYDHGKAIRKDTTLGPIADLAFVRLKQESGFDPEETKKYLDHPHHTLAERVVAILARNRDLSKNDFSKMEEQEEDPDLSLVLRLLSNEDIQSSLRDDLAFINLISREQDVQKIMLNDRLLWFADQVPHSELLREAARNEVLSDGECAVLYACLDQQGTASNVFDTAFDLKNPRHTVHERIGDLLFRTAVDYGGPETRAFLLHRLLTVHSNEDSIDALLVLISYLDGDRCWFEESLMKFYGTKESDIPEQIDPNVAQLIAWSRRSDEAGIDELISEMADEELRPRPELLSYMWDSRNASLWKRAWRVGSSVSGIHPLLSDHLDGQASDGGRWRPSVAVVDRLVTSQNSTEDWPDIAKILVELGPRTEWPECLALFVRTKEKEIFGFESFGVGDLLSHSKILSVMSIGQLASELDDQGFLPPRQMGAEADAREFSYQSTVGHWEISYEKKYWDENDPPNHSLKVSYGPLEYAFHLDDENRITRKRLHHTSFDISGPEDHDLLREFEDDIVGATITKNSITVYTDEDAFYEAGVINFGDSGDITMLNALYDFLDQPSPYYFKGWMVWGHPIERILDLNGDRFQWSPDSSIMEEIYEADEEYLRDEFGEVSEKEVLQIARNFVLKDEEEIRENFRRWGIECEEII